MREQFLAEVGEDPLGDFLFVASRVMNDNGAGDVLWVPGQNR